MSKTAKNYHGIEELPSLRQQNFVAASARNNFYSSEQVEKRVGTGENELTFSRYTGRDPINGNLDSGK